MAKKQEYRQSAVKKKPSGPHRDGARKARKSIDYRLPATHPRYASSWFYAALDFAAAADAYVSFYDQQHTAHVSTFLLAQSLELAIKCSLLAKKVPYKEVRALEHDLTAAVRLAQSRKISVIDPSAKDANWAISALTNAYVSKELQYPERGMFSRPRPKLLRQLIHGAIQLAAQNALRPEILTKAHVRPPPGFTLEFIERYR
jgi:hypothetical protein